MSSPPIRIGKQGGVPLAIPVEARLRTEWRLAGILSLQKSGPGSSAVHGRGRIAGVGRTPFLLPQVISQAQKRNWGWQEAHVPPCMILRRVVRDPPLHLTG